jgi:ribose 5-phosphate isomerase B
MMAPKRTRPPTQPRAMIAIASDRAGLDLKELLVEELKAMGETVLDLGTHSADSVDHPDFGDALARAITQGRAARGVLVCGTGIGISIAANRHKGIRAAHCRDTTDARYARLHNDANVIALGARTMGVEVAKDCLKIFLATGFEGGRHQRRVDKLG